MGKQNNIKLLFVSHEYGIGGSTVSLVSLIQGLKEYSNIEVTVLLPAKSGELAKAKKLLENNGIHYREFWYRRNFKRVHEKYSLKFHMFDLLNMLAVKRIKKYIKKQQFHIVCSNSTGVDVGARAARLADVPHIYYVREFMKTDHNCEYRNKKRMKRLLESSEYVIFISKAVEKYYTFRYAMKKTKQFYDGFVVKDYFVENHVILIEDKITFVQAGAFSDGKGTLDTIEMLHLLNQKGITNWTMEFVGKSSEASYMEEMKRLIEAYHLEAQITIGTFCLDMKEKLSQKDILMMNSKSEGFGRVTVEGMLAGCQVMGRYAGGTTEIIEDNINGVAFNEAKDFVEAVCQIDADRKKYIELANNGQKYAIDKFDCANTTKEFMGILNACLM